MIQTILGKIVAMILPVKVFNFLILLYFSRWNRKFSKLKKKKKKLNPFMLTTELCISIQFDMIFFLSVRRDVFFDKRMISFFGFYR